MKNIRKVNLRYDSWQKKLYYIFENPGPCNIAMSFIFWIIDELIGRSTKEIDIYNIFSTDIYSSLLGVTRRCYKSLDVNVVVLPLLKFLFRIYLYIKRYYKKTLLESRNIDK